MVTYTFRDNDIDPGDIDLEWDLYNIVVYGWAMIQRRNVCRVCGVTIVCVSCTVCMCVSHMAGSQQHGPYTSSSGKSQRVISLKREEV